MGGTESFREASFFYVVTIQIFRIWQLLVGLLCTIKLMWIWQMLMGLHLYKTHKLSIWDAYPRVSLALAKIYSVSYGRCVLGKSYLKYGASLLQPLNQMLQATGLH
jgi:hypothetical protein